MPLELAVFIFFIVTFPFLLAIDHFRTRRKLRIRLEKAFGKSPSGSYRLTGLDSYWRTFARHKAHWPVDDITWADLDMDEIFDRIDACQSSLGSGCAPPCPPNSCSSGNSCWLCGRNSPPCG